MKVMKLFQASWYITKLIIHSSGAIRMICTYCDRTALILGASKSRLCRCSALRIHRTTGVWKRTKGNVMNRHTRDCRDKTNKATPKPESYHPLHLMEQVLHPPGRQWYTKPSRHMRTTTIYISQRSISDILRQFTTCTQLILCSLA